MKIWIDAQLPPTLASWLKDNFDLEATALRDLELRDAKDTEIFEEMLLAVTYGDYLPLLCLMH